MFPNPLDSLTFPRIDEDLAKELGSPISPQEVKEVINSMQNPQAPMGLQLNSTRHILLY